MKKSPKSERLRESTGQIRPPAVAGSFYPDSPTELDAAIGTLLKSAEVIYARPVKILVVPHAGIDYSGQISAWGFKQIKGKKITRIILLGTSHQAFFNYAAVYNKGFWKTPLGKIGIDEDLAKKLIDDKQIIADLIPHQEEHSLEIELIFLQKVLKDFKIVPLLLSQTSNELVENLAQKISENLDEKTLLIVSTDLSHYPPYEVANKVDNETIKAILTGNKEIFENTIQNLESQDLPKVETCACGAEAVKVALKIGEILGLEFKKIKYENSGDVAGEKSRVVGYVAVVGQEKTYSAQPLDESVQKEALAIARKILEQCLQSPTSLIRPIFPKSKDLLAPRGAFVTLRNNNQLRGCIGEFEPKEPLYKVIQDMAIEAATKDPRFYPVTAQELSEIKIEISVMTPKRKIGSWQEIELGKHGVVIQKGLNAGTFLPQVAAEAGWNLEEFLSHLCFEKAGLPVNCYKDPSVNLYVFEAQIFTDK